MAGSDTTSAVFEGMLHHPLSGKPGPGRLAVVVAPPGVGKSACLVQIALMELLKGRSVLHVAIDQTVGHVRQRYDDLIRVVLEQARNTDRAELREVVEGRRHIHTYKKKSFTAEKLDEAISHLGTYMGLRPTTVIIDGLNLGSMTAHDMSSLKELSEQVKAQVWLSAVATRQEMADSKDRSLPGVVASHADLLSLVLALMPSSEGIVLRLLKDEQQDEHLHDLGLVLDPVTMLVQKRSCPQQGPS